MLGVMYVYVYIYIYKYVGVCIVYTRVHIYKAYMYTCMGIRMYVYVCIYTYYCVETGVDTCPEGMRMYVITVRILARLAPGPRLL